MILFTSPILLIIFNFLLQIAASLGTDFGENVHKILLFYVDCLRKYNKSLLTMTRYAFIIID